MTRSKLITRGLSLADRSPKIPYSTYQSCWIISLQLLWNTWKTQICNMQLKIRVQHHHIAGRLYHMI